MNARRWALVALSFAAALGVSGWVVWRGWREAGAPPALPLWAHLAALAAVLFEIGARATKIHFSAAALRIPLRWGVSLRTCLGGDFAAAITPGRSGAEPARFVILADAGVRPAHTLVILFTELFLELISLAVMAVVLAVVFRGGGPVVAAMTTVIGGYATFVLGVGAVGYLLAHRSSNGPPPALVRRVGLHAGHWRAVQRVLRHLRASLLAVRDARLGPMLASLGFSVLHVFGKLAVLPPLVWAVAPDVPLADLVLWPLVFLYGGAIAPAPAGGGAIEFGFQLAFRDVLSPALLAGSLIWWRAYTLYLYILLGALAAGSTARRALRDTPEEPA